MKTIHVSQCIARFLIVLLFIVTLVGTQPVLAQSGEPPQPPPSGPRVPPQEDLAGGPPEPGMVYEPNTGQWLAVSSQPPAQPQRQMDLAPMGGAGQNSSAATSDYYGYNWSATTYNWIAANSGGTLAPLSANTWDLTGAINLPFSFKFYENIYNQVYISKHGYLTFTDTMYVTDQSRVPHAYYPNNIIAPNWTPIHLAASGGTNRVYYKSYGSTPGSRYFVIQWYMVKGGWDDSDPIGGNDVYDFEAILHENGDIVFQYRLMTYNSEWWCSGFGIEDIRGTDGLGHLNFCNAAAGGTAFRYTRPTNKARVLLFPTKFGAFAAPGGQATLLIPVKNIGDLGEDSFDIQWGCNPGYPVTAYDAATGALLENTGGTSDPDIGPVAPGATKTVKLVIDMPAYGNVGDGTKCNFWAIPVREFNQWRYASVSAAIPAPFTQVYRDDTDGTMRFTPVSPDAQPEFMASGANTPGMYAATAETPTGNIVYVWSMWRCITANCSRGATEIYYTIRKPDGGTVKATTRLADISALGNWAYDEDPAIAVAPNNTIGIVFERYLERSDYKFNMNVHLARLDANGNILGITNLTNYAGYNNYSANNHYRFYEPAITATTDNRFLTAWRRYHTTASGSFNDIFGAVNNSAGASVQAPTAYTTDIAGSSTGYYSPSLAALDGNRAFLIYRSIGDDDLYFQVRSSAGLVIYSATNLTNDGTDDYEYYPDVARFSNGNVLVGWVAGGATYYTVLDSGFNQIISPTYLSNLSYPYWPYCLSVTTDNAGRGILTWMDDDIVRNQDLYYAAVNSAGQLLTDTMAMKHSSAAYLLSWMGNSSTTRTITPGSSGADLALSGPARFVVNSGGSATIPARFRNQGLAAASTITITATKPDEIAFGSIPGATCAGNTCTWTLTDANLGFLGGGALALPIGIPGSPAGTTYQVTFHIDSPETDENAANDDLVVQIISGTPLYLPVTLR